MSYTLPDAAAAIRVAAALSAMVKQPGNHYRAKRYTAQQGFMTVPKWGVMEFEPVPDHLRRHWPDGFKPCGFVWNPAQLVGLGVAA